jgi:hypothetical protein
MSCVGSQRTRDHPMTAAQAVSGPHDPTSTVGWTCPEGAEGFSLDNVTGSDDPTTR